MPEVETETETKWYEEDNEITSNADLMKHIKDHGFEETPTKAVRAHFELQKKMGASYRLPDDLSKLTPEQKADILARTQSLMNVPESAEGYEFDKPELPGGMSYNDNLENAYRAFCKENGVSKELANLGWNFVNNAGIAAFNQQEEQRRTKTIRAEQEFRVRKGDKFEQVMEGIKRARLHLTEKLGLGYVDKDTGETRSRLDDCLDTTGLGSSIPINEVLSYIYETYLAEGQPIKGSGEGGAKAGSFFDYSKVDK
jgi:hypothetical protein